MNYSKQSQSGQALSDPMPRTYSCFCGKLFTTYPGIYLHLKSKHSHLFQNYKQLKITKLFKKIISPQGTTIYQLDKLPDRQADQCKISQMPVKQPKQVKQQQLIIIEDGLEEQQQVGRQRKSSNTRASQASKRKVMNNVQPRQYLHPDFDPQIERQRLMQRGLGGFPMGMPFPPFPPFFAGYPPLMPELRITTKKLIQKYLQQIHVVDKLSAKKYLYDLMVFIDNNCQHIRDPRTHARLFLSYCCDFQPEFVGPLMLSYLSAIEEKSRHSKFDGQSSELQCIKGLVEWLKETGMVRFEFNNASHSDKRRQTNDGKIGEVNVLVECSDSGQNYEIKEKQQ